MRYPSIPSSRADASFGPSLFLLASRGNASDLAQALADGLNPNHLADSFGRTPLMQAVLYGHHACVELLLATGADFLLVDANGHTSLMLCALAPRDGALSCARILVAHGKARLASQADKHGRDALMASAAHGRVDLCAFLALHCDPLARSDDGRSALAWAAARGHVGAIKLLAEHSDLWACERLSGNHALALAQEGGHADAVRLLVALMERHRLDENTPCSSTAPSMAPRI
jgi:ankyrin repeat protein